MDTLALIRRMVEHTPAGSMIPVDWLRDVLQGESGIAPDSAAPGAVADLTLEDAADQVKRSISTVRGWCASGAIPGAYKLMGRSWMIPPAALRSFLDAQASGVKASEPRTRADKAPNLGRWRRNLKKAG